MEEEKTTQNTGNEEEPNVERDKESGEKQEGPMVAEEAKETAEKPDEEEELTEEEEAAQKLPFPTAAVVRVMKTKLDNDKMIKKEVKIAMNKWLGDMCQAVSLEMNKIPYVMMHLHEFNRAKDKFDNIQEFQREKERILSHLDAMKADIAKLERDLGRIETGEDEI